MPAPRSSTTATKPKARRSEPAERVTPASEDPTERRRDQARRQRYERQRARAIERGEPTSVGEAVDQAYDAGVKKGQTQKARGDATSNVVSNLPSGSIGVGNMLAPLLVETVLITADEFVRFKRWPLPSRYLAAWFIFGGLSLASGSAARPATVVGWGLVLATAYAFVTPGSTNKSGALDALGKFFGGNPSSTVSVNPIPNASPAPPATVA